MAKMRDGIFELVINIQGFEPEDVQIFCVDQEQAVYVKAKHVTEEGFVNNVYEQKFSLPDDVDTQKLTSGMSRDGILMIRVPRAVSPERIIPIKREVKMEAVKKALKDCIHYSVEMNETSVEQIHAELEEANIVPLNVEKPEDAVKAASAEVVEAQTIGVAESAGAEAGEAAGLSAGVLTAMSSVATLVSGAVVEAVERVARDIAGEAGVKAAMASGAVKTGEETGARIAQEMGAEMGAEVGRMVGGQAASVAAAEAFERSTLYTGGSDSLDSRTNS